MPPIAATVIFTTYNQPLWLEHVLSGFALQDRTDFEVIVADDGSDARTTRSVARLADRLPFPVRHLWQADRGFRKCRILNAAIAASRSDYLIFTDGDCIPRSDFVSAHLRLRAPARFLSGGYYKLSRELSAMIGHEDIVQKRCFGLAWLRARGLPREPRNAKLVAHGPVADLLDYCLQARASWNGHNASAWKSDLLACNGFDERMGYGGEDRELGERLEHAGVRGYRVRHRAVVLHLDHARGYVREQVLRQNHVIWEETRQTRRVRTPAGLTEAFVPPEDPILFQAVNG